MKKYLALMVIVGFLFMSVPNAKAVTMGELETQVKSLLQEVKDLRAQLAQRVLGESTVSVDAITKPLSLGIRSKDVQALQEFLKTEGDLKIATPTNYFGPLTRDAVKSFQARNSLSVTGRISSADLTRIRTLNESRNLTSPVAGCTASTAPFITVVAPNGGEIYPAGAQVTVRWKSCNMPISSTVLITLWSSQLDADPSGGSEIIITANDGQEVVTLPTNGGQGNLPLASGNYYKIGIAVGGNPALRDFSDNLFTINNTQQTGCALNGATLVASSSTPSQYIATAGTSIVTDATKATYNFTTASSACNATVTISELKFIGTFSNLSGQPTIESVKVGNASAPAVTTDGQSVVYLTGLNFVVPNQGTGLNLDALVSYPTVNANLPSGSISQLRLIYVKYMDNSTGTFHTENLSVPAPSMMLVGSKPILAIAQPSNSLVAGSNHAIDVTVTADSHGTIAVNWIPLILNLGGATISSGNANTLVVKDSNNNIVNSTNTAFASTTGGSSIITISPWGIQSGSSETFKIYVPVTSVSVGSGAFMSSSINNPANFAWKDVAGNGGTLTTQNTTYLYNYPINSSVINGN